MNAAGPSGLGQPGALTVYARERFYQELPEPEETFTGRLERQEVVLGPGNRPHPFRLALDHGSLDVYATPSVEKALAAHVGQRVRIRGKRVDLTSEGFGPELWIGTIQRME